MPKNSYIYRLLMFKDYIDYWYKMIWNMSLSQRHNPGRQRMAPLETAWSWVGKQDVRLFVQKIDQHHGNQSQDYSPWQNGRLLIKPKSEEISKDQLQVPTECTTCNLFMTQINSYITCTTFTTKELRKWFWGQLIKAKLAHLDQPIF